MEMKEITTFNIANLVSITDYAKLRGVSRQTIYNWIESKDLKTTTVLGKTYVDKSSAKK